MNELLPDQYGHLTIEEWQVVFDKQIRNQRLLENINQATLAGKANISVAALKNLESGKGSTLGTLLRVVRALDQEDWLLKFSPEITVNPLDTWMHRHKKTIGARATGNRKLKDEYRDPSIMPK